MYLYVLKLSFIIQNFPEIRITSTKKSRVTKDEHPPKITRDFYFLKLIKITYLLIYKFVFFNLLFDF